jgi:hypothetical protein
MRARHDEECDRSNLDFIYYLLPLYKFDTIPQCANLAYRHFHDRPRNEILRRLQSSPNSTRRSRHNDRSPTQRCSLRQIMYQISAIEQQVIHILLLPHLTVHNRLKQQPLRITNQFRCNQRRTYRRKCIKSFGEPPLRNPSCEFRVALQFSRGHIVATCVCSDVV